jgi:hypothetical protein
MNLRRIVPGVMLVCLLLPAVASAAGAKGTVTGEVIDSACYIKSGMKGPDHAKCVVGCAKAGIPLALLTDDGTVVFLASAEDMENPNELLIPFAAKRVTLEGQWYERGGAKLFAVEKVTPAPAK